jgi:hypothetical protein
MLTVVLEYQRIGRERRFASSSEWLSAPADTLSTTRANPTEQVGQRLLPADEQ